jgi:2-oxoglutarate dehydrogenase E2 component (dihydrolipoamide succinyltransferase)
MCGALLRRRRIALMSVELKIPSAGESISEVQIGEWRKAEGERVERDEIVVEIETDKASMELPAPVSGTLERIVHLAGATVQGWERPAGERWHREEGEGEG